jgi:hypothetical protein
MNALPGNSSVNTVQHATIDYAGFSMSSAPRPTLLRSQWTRSLTCDTCFLCGLCRSTIERLCSLRGPCRKNMVVGIDFKDCDKWQTRPLVREGAPVEQDSNFHLRKRNLVMGPRRVLDTKTYWLTHRQSQYDLDLDFELTGLEFRRSKGTAMWPEEELEGFIQCVTSHVL